MRPAGLPFKIDGYTAPVSGKTIRKTFQNQKPGWLENKEAAASFNLPKMS
jgi:hypothetical protein